MSLSAAGKFCYRLGVGLGAGADMLKLLASEASNGPAGQRDAMRMLADGASRGEQLSAVMESRSPFFPPLMVAMTRVGEETGRLERALLALADHYEHQRKTQTEFLRSVAWPMMQLAGGLMVVSLLILLMGILTPAGGGQMPDLLGFDLRGARGVLTFWLYVGTTLGLIAGLIWAFHRNLGGIQNLIPLIYMIPKIGSAIQTITISRFCWTTALSLGSGLDPIRSIRLGLECTDSDYYRSGIDDSENAIRGGATLAGALEATRLFPEEFISRVEISELSGTDAESMANLASEYEERAQTAVRVLAGLASVLVRVAVMLFLLFMIYRLSSFYLGVYNEALAPISPR